MQNFDKSICPAHANHAFLPILGQTEDVFIVLPHADCHVTNAFVLS